MSLVNDMLRDLQARRVPGGPPLVDLDLEPVLLGNEPRTSLTALLTALAFALPLYLVTDGMTEQNVGERADVIALETDTARPQLAAETDTTVVEGRSDAEEEAAPPAGAKIAEAVVMQAAVTPEKRTSAPESPAAVEKEVRRPAPVAPATVPTEAPRPSVAAMNKRPVQSAASSVNKDRLRDAVLRSPNDGAAWMGLYENLLGRGDEEAAEAAILEGLGSAADPSPLAHRYARTLIGRGELSQARSVLQDHRPAAVFDEDYEALLAWLLQSTQRHREAAESYRALVARNSQLGDWWVGLAISLENIGDRKGAVHAYERARGSAQIKSTLAKYAGQRIASLNADGQS